MADSEGDARQYTDEQERNRADRLIMPTLNAAATINAMGYNSDVTSLTGLLSALTKQVEQSLDGYPDRGDAMLVSQAHTLDALFANLLQRAFACENISQQEIYMKLALKAQSQTRTTIETNERLKHPSVSNHVKQANIVNGPQQINIGIAQDSQESQIAKPFQENKLLEEEHVERVDTRTPSETGRDDSTVETMVEINRPHKRWRKV